MYLAITVIQRPTIRDRGRYRRTVEPDRFRRQSSDREVAISQPIQESTAILGKGLAERRRDRDGLDVLLIDGDTCRPRLEAVDVSRFDGSARMAATRLAAVFNIDAHHHPLSLRKSIGTGTDIVILLYPAKASPNQALAGAGRGTGPQMR